jgi:hypothetical protein
LPKRLFLVRPTRGPGFDRYDPYLYTFRNFLDVSIKVFNKYQEQIEIWSDFEKEQGSKDGKAMLISNLVNLASSYEADVINYNSKQNELKVGSNSTFGFLGAGGKVQFSSVDGRIIHRAMMQVYIIKHLESFKTRSCQFLPVLHILEERR